MNYKKMMLCLFFIAIGFYLLPNMIVDTGSAMFVLLLVFPILCFVCSMIYGIIDKLNPLFSILVILLYFPTIFIYYNDSAMIYALIYGVVSFVGLCIGSLFSKK